MEEPNMRVIDAGNQRRSVQWLRHGLAVVVLGVIAIVGANVAGGQVLYGTLTGNVTDSSGAALPGAEVTAVNTLTGDKSTQPSDSAGIYRFTALPPGTYNITIAANGFAKQETAGVVLVGNEIKRVDAQLRTGTVATEVTVTGAPAI